MEKLSALLRVRPGVTALVGSGGKTTAMYQLASELAESGTVVCATTTHIFPPSHMPVWTEDDPETLAAASEGPAVPVRGAHLAQRESSPPPSSPSPPWRGSRTMCWWRPMEPRGLPLKAHLPHEPVIPPQAGDVILVAGASGLGRPAREAVHRPERFCELAGLLWMAPSRPGPWRR